MFIYYVNILWIENRVIFVIVRFKENSTIYIFYLNFKKKIVGMKIGFYIFEVWRRFGG